MNEPTPVYNTYAASIAPIGQLKTNKSLVKLFLLSLITFGVYGIVVKSSVRCDISVVASREDGKRAMHYWGLLFLVGPVTLGIADLVWNHRLANRLGAELTRRGINYSISASTFWLWGILGCLIVVGPFVYLHKLLKATSLLCEHYNVNG